MITRWLAPLALLVLSPALAHADPTPTASASGAPSASAAAASEPAAKAAPAAAAPVAPAATPATPATPAAKAPAARKVAGKPEAKQAAADKPATRRPRRIIEQREAAAAKAGGEQRYDMTITTRSPKPLINFVIQKTPVQFALPELHPGQYDVPTGLSR